MKKVLLKSMMLLCLLFVGMGAWADEVTSTFTNNQWAVGSGEPVWVKTGANATSFESASPSRGVQTTLTNIKSSGLSLKNTTIKNLGNITSIKLTISSNGTGGSISSVKVGSTDFKCSGNNSYTIENSNGQTPTFSSATGVSGDIVITFSSTATTKSLYVKSITVTYQDAGKTALGTPSNLTSTNVTDRSATLTWDAVSNAESYQVKVGTTEYETNTNSYTVTGLEANTDYSWSVKALAGSSATYSDGNYSAESNFRTTDFVVSAGTYNIVPTNTFFNCEEFTNKPKDFTGATGTKYGITIEYVAAANAYINSAQCRAYSGTKLIFTAPSGFKLTNITFTADGDNWAGTHTADVGTMTNTKTWNGCSDVVSITFAGTCRITNIQLTYIPATADVTIGATGYATFVAPYNLDFSESGVTAYAVTPVLAENKVTLTPVTEVPAGKAIVVKGTADTHSIPTVASAEDFTTELEVSATAIKAAEGDEYTYYYLGKEDDAVGFRPLNVTGTLAAGKCFFKVVNGGSARFMRIATEGETTGIKTVESAKNNAVVYNLAGQRVAANAKGIVIVNGKKMLNK